MFDSTDILYIVLAFCALWLTAFLCWLIWQISMILKNVNDFFTDVRDKIGKIETAITSIRQRFEALTSSASFVMEGAKKVADFVREKRADHHHEEEEKGDEEGKK